MGYGGVPGGYHGGGGGKQIGIAYWMPAIDLLTKTTTSEETSSEVVLFHSPLLPTDTLAEIHHR